MDNPPYFPYFLSIDWEAQHFCDRFCFGCALAFCSASCPDHAAHHGGGGGEGHQNYTHSSGCPAMEATIAKCRTGYGFTHIQRFGKGTELCILLVPPLRPDNRCKAAYCDRCHGRCKSGMLYCGLDCKLAMTQGGGIVMPPSCLLIKHHSSGPRPTGAIDSARAVCLLSVREAVVSTRAITCSLTRETTALLSPSSGCRMAGWPSRSDSFQRVWSPVYRRS